MDHSSSHSENRRPEPPERLGPYRLDRLLGSGGMGVVWRAWDERLERWVALKQVRAGATLSHGRELLRREARAVARLSHPAIVRVYDILEGADGDWIVMELVEGRTLRCLLDEAALPPAQAVRLCREIAEGLAEAHAHGILHRDLKASNVIVGSSGRAKILDFGLAKELPREGDPEGQELTASTPGVIPGTCFAMSPEQVLGSPLDERSDLFSLGSLLYEMLTGEPPFRAESSTLSLAKVLHHEVPPLHESHPGLPPEICDLVDWLLQKEPPRRPRSASEVVAALETAVRPAALVQDGRPAESLHPGNTFDVALAIQSQMPAAVQVKDLDVTVDVYELGPSVEPESWEGSPPLPLIGREAELQILLDHFRLARSGSGQAMLIAGEAGIGKSRLVRALAERLAAEAPAWLTAHGSALAQSTPLSPLVYLLSQAIFGPEGSAEMSGRRKLDRLEEVLDEHGLSRPDHAPFLGALLSVPMEERYPPLVLSPETRRRRTLAAILALLGAMAEHRPVVLVIEDLHWVDPTTLDLLDRLLEEISVLPLLLVATFRPEFSPPWRHQTSVTQLNLAGLSEAHTAELIERVSEGRRLPAEVQREIAARTDGVPLFVEELTKTVLEGDTPAGIPLTLGGPLLARLDRLGEAKAVAQLASVIGRTFTLEQLEALSWIKGAALQAALSELLQAEILYRRGPVPRACYVFKHALIQDVAYRSLLAGQGARELLDRLSSPSQGECGAQSLVFV